MVNTYFISQLSLELQQKKEKPTVTRTVPEYLHVHVIPLISNPPNQAVPLLERCNIDNAVTMTLTDPKSIKIR